MWTYYWYLVENSWLPENEKQPRKWLLICPDFPQTFFQVKLEEWNSSKIYDKAHEIIEQKLKEMLAEGLTIPSAQKKHPGYLGFGVKIAL